MRTHSTTRRWAKNWWCAAIRGVAIVGGPIVTIALSAATATASVALLTPGHAYCYYFSGPGRSGGMHLVAASPSVIAAGPSNYISGTNGKPQDSVFYVDCVAGKGRVGGDFYIGIPRISMQLSGGHYVFDRRFIRHGVRHLGIGSNSTSTVAMTISGSVSSGLIKGSVQVSAPGCLPRAMVITYSGT